MKHELTAFCVTCPSETDVTAMLAALGCALVFSLPGAKASRYVRAMPAQFHYRDCHGTEAIYLAGRDTDFGGHGIPAHRSRFWVTCGRDMQAYGHVVWALAAQYGLHWRPESSSQSQVPSHADVA